MHKEISKDALQWREFVNRAIGERSFVAVGPIPEAAGVEWVNLITSDKLGISITPAQTLTRDAWEGKDAEGEKITHPAYTYEQPLTFTISDGLGLFDEGEHYLSVTPSKQGLSMSEAAELIAESYWAVFGLMSGD